MNLTDVDDTKGEDKDVEGVIQSDMRALEELFMYGKPPIYQGKEE